MAETASGMPGLALVTALALWAGPPQQPPRYDGPPSRSSNGSGLMAVGITLKVLSLGGGIAGIVFVGLGKELTLLSAVPSAHGGGLLVMGASVRGRHQAWYDSRDLLAQARTARRVGWPLLGVGIGLFVGNAIAILAWPYSPNCADEGCEIRYFGGFVAVGSGFQLGQLMIGGSASALAWSYAYSKARSRRVELMPTLGGLSMRF